MSKGLPQMDWALFPTQIFWLACTFVILYFIVKVVAVPRIQGSLVLRTRSIETDLAEAKRLQAQAAGLSESYEQRLSAAREEAVKTVTGAVSHAKQQISAKEDALSQVLDVRFQEADKNILGFLADSQARLGGIVEELSSAMLARLSIAGADVPSARQKILGEA